MHIVKAHAYGNDFVLAPLDASHGQLPALARALCDRHTGIGADGVIFYAVRDRGAAMTLFNADGSASELSGNGLRCLAAHVVRSQELPPGSRIRVETDAGPKELELIEVRGSRYTLRAALGAPRDVRQLEVPVGGRHVTATALNVGNPQLVVLGPLPAEADYNRLGPALAAHPMFPEGTNVEFAHVEAPDRVRILIWERGVGPTSSSGTGTAASAVAAAAHGGAARQMDVVAPGGTQRVEWRADGIYLTGWAEIVLDGSWLGGGPGSGSSGSGDGT